MHSDMLLKDRDGTLQNRLPFSLAVPLSLSVLLLPSLALSATTSLCWWGNSQNYEQAELVCGGCDLQLVL